MSSDATTLSTPGALIGGSRLAGELDSSDERTGERRHALIGALVLAVLVGGCALLVVLAADRPSFLTSPSHSHFFPHWLAGPLGGIWPGFPRGTYTLRYLFTFALVAMYASYLLGLRYLPRLSPRWAIVGVLAVHAILFLSPPLALTDIFNYVNYGRMEVVHHLNPYTTIPMLEPHGDPSFDLSNWHSLLSPYGPIFTLITFAVVPLGVAGSFWVLKAILMLASLGTIFLVWKCARLLDRDPVQAIVFVGLNPIVLVWGLGGDHNDFIMIFFIVLGLYLVLRGGVSVETRAAEDLESDHPGGKLRGWLWPLAPLELGAGAAFVTAIAIKASGAIMLPVVLAALLRAPRRLVQVLLGMIASGVVLGAISLWAFGPHLPDLSTQSRLVTSVSLPNLLGLALGQGGETDTLRLILSGVLVLSVALCGWLAWRTRAAVTATGWAAVALLVTLSWVLPWYVLWVLPLAALSRSKALRLTALTLGVYLIISWAPLTAEVFNAIGFHPERTSLGRLHQRYVKELLY